MLVLALIKTERRVLVVHQGDVGEDSVEPAIDADEQVEEAARVLPGDQQEEAGALPFSIAPAIAPAVLAIGGGSYGVLYAFAGFCAILGAVAILPVRSVR